MQYNDSIHVGHNISTKSKMAMLHLAAVSALCIALASCQDLPYTYPEQALSGTTSLYFGLMQSFGGTYNGSGSIPGVELALDNINNDQELLPGYTLRYVLRDSFVSVKAVYCSVLQYYVCVAGYAAVHVLLLCS